MAAADAARAEVTARVVDALTGISLDKHRTRYDLRRSRRLELAWLSRRSDYRYLPFVPNPEDHRVHRLGFRGDEISAVKPANTYRVFCLGGSTTWEEYPEFLERELAGDLQACGLRLDVVNAGNLCWTTSTWSMSMLSWRMPNIG